MVLLTPTASPTPALAEPSRVHAFVKTHYAFAWRVLRRAGLVPADADDAAAQDFMAAFEVGSSDLTILQVDADGVAFAAIQALNTRLKALEEKNQELQRKLAEQSQRCEH